MVLFSVNFYLQTPHFRNNSNFHINTMADNRYAVDYARMGTSSCKKCKQTLGKGDLRLAKVVKNPFTDDDKDMKHYHHPKCLFETFIRAKCTTRIIEEVDDIEEFSSLKDEDQDMINTLIIGMFNSYSTKQDTNMVRLIWTLNL